MICDKCGYVVPDGACVKCDDINHTKRWECPKCKQGNDMPTMRQFNTGATRNVDTTKLDFEGFLSPAVLTRYAQYLNKHRVQADGKIRDSDNWQKGIPKDVYMKSAFRHFMDMWFEHRGIETEAGLQDAACAVLFNVMGYLYEDLKHEENKRTS